MFVVFGIVCIILDCDEMLHGEMSEWPKVPLLESQGRRLARRNQVTAQRGNLLKFVILRYLSRRDVRVAEGA